ncbi:MAG TPA: ABC transporter substrate-binding protein [Negativicutes bacterium]
MKKRISNKLITTIMVISVILSLLAAGCSNNEQKKTAAETTGKKYDVLKIPTTVDFTRPDIFELGEQLGFFEEEGIKFERIGAVPAPQLVAAVVAGKIDIGAAHFGRTIAGISAGAKIKAVVAGTETTQKIPHMVIITTAKSPIKTAQDLVGKKIGIPTIGGCNEYTPYAYMTKNGIDNPKSKVEVIVMPESNLEQALRQGDIDAAAMHKNPEVITASGELRLLFTDYDVWGSDGGGTPFYFSEKFIQEKPDVVRRFVAAVAKTNNWANANEQKAIDMTVEKNKLDPKSLRTGHFGPDGIIKAETAQIWIDLLTQYGEIKPGLQANQVYTNEFNPFAKK